MGVKHVHEDGAVGDEALMLALTSGDAVTRIMARGAASGWVGPFTAWINDELRRNKRQADVVVALATLQIQTFASIAAQISQKQGDGILVDAFINLARDELPKHMAKTREQEWAT